MTSADDNRQAFGIFFANFSNGDSKFHYLVCMKILSSIVVASPPFDNMSYKMCVPDHNTFNDIRVSPTMVGDSSRSSKPFEVSATYDGLVCCILFNWVEGIISHEKRSYRWRLWRSLM
jgi:hypothetical protein